MPDTVEILNALENLRSSLQTLAEAGAFYFRGDAFGGRVGPVEIMVDGDRLPELARVLGAEPRLELAVRYGRYPFKLSITVNGVTFFSLMAPQDLAKWEVEIA